MTDTGGPDVESLLERVKTAKSSGGQICWYKTVEPEIQRFIDAAQALLDEKPHLNRAEIRRILNDEKDGYGLRASREQVNRHLRRECQCSKEI